MHGNKTKPKRYVFLDFKGKDVNSTFSCAMKNDSNRCKRALSREVSKERSRINRRNNGTMFDDLAKNKKNAR